MSPLKRRVCTHCGATFPRVIPPSLWVTGGILVIKGLRCKKCGETSLYRIDWRKAALLWPVGVVMLALPVVLRGLSILETDHGAGRAFFTALTLCCLLGALGCFEAAVELRRGPSEEGPAGWYRRWRYVIVVAVFLVGFGALTGDWPNVIVGGGVALVFWLVAARRGQKAR